VRLRAIISLGGLGDPRAVPTLLQGLTDANRLVRLRAAEALVGLRTEMAPIFQHVVEIRDRYGLHAYLTALENANLQGKLEAELQASTKITTEERQRLESVLQTGALPAEEAATAERIPDKAGLRP